MNARAHGLAPLGVYPNNLERWQWVLLRSLRGAIKEIAQRMAERIVLRKGLGKDGDPSIL